MLRQRAISSVFIVLLTLGPAILGRTLFAVVAAAIFGLIVHEFTNLLRQAGHRPVAGIGYLILLGALLLVTTHRWEQWSTALIVAAIFLPLLVILFRPDHRGALVDWAVTTAAALYVAIPAAHFVLLRDLPGSLHNFVNQLDATGAWQSPLGQISAVGLAWYLLAQCVTWLTDVGAYLFGRLWGRHKLAPLISPGKSVEGAVGGLVLGGLTAMLCAWGFGLPMAAPLALAVGIFLSVCGQLGDLAESLLKRQAGIKDSSTLIPGHGGIFDRLDSLLIVATVTYYLARIIG